MCVCVCVCVGVCVCVSSLDPIGSLGGAPLLTTFDGGESFFFFHIFWPPFLFYFVFFSTRFAANTRARACLFFVCFFISFLFFCFFVVVVWLPLGGFRPREINKKKRRKNGRTGDLFLVPVSLLLSKIKRWNDPLERLDECFGSQQKKNTNTNR